MNEARLQHDFVMWFRQKWPEYSNLLFMVHNEAKSKKEASYLKSMGLVPGASDLALIHPHYGYFIGIELKAPGSRHSKEHIEQQLNWGKQVIENNGYYLMTSNMDVLQRFCKFLIDYNPLRVYDIQTDELFFIEHQLKAQKTIKF